VANKDLRDWIAGIETAGELKIIRGAEPKEEIGGIVDIYMRRMGHPAVMFDEVPGFPKGYRVLANIPRRSCASMWRSVFRRKGPKSSSRNGGATT
jgi:3-polyprenyl-4-hydroxybenzoate decarboxylase